MKDYLNGVGKVFCSYCKKYRTPQGYDPCIGELKNVMNVCCGHGEDKMAYVQINHDNYKNDPNKYLISGAKAVSYIAKFSPVKNTKIRTDINSEANTEQ